MKRWVGVDEMVLQKSAEWAAGSYHLVSIEMMFVSDDPIGSYQGGVELSAWLLYEQRRQEA